MSTSFLQVLAIGFSVTLFSAIILVLTQRFHGGLTFDSADGVQKFHKKPTPRIGGVPIAIGYLVVWFFQSGEVRELWALIGLSAAPALIFGLGDDITGKVSVRARLLASLAAGIVFCLLSGYSVTRLDIPGFDYFLTFHIASLMFSAFAIGGVIQAINMIDGFHGLASGTVIFILASVALVASRVGDSAILMLSLSMSAVVAGFFAINFPLGKIFLGDSGAYICGFFVAVLAVMLPARNPEMSPWVSLLILGYPVIETTASIVRRILGNGQRAGAPDSAHLHHLIYKSWARIAASRMNQKTLANPMTSLFIWPLPAFTLICTSFVNLRTLDAAILFVLTVVIYAIFYRALLTLQLRSAKQNASPDQKLVR